MSKKIKIREQPPEEQNASQQSDQQAADAASSEDLAEEMELLTRRLQEVEESRNEFRDLLQRKQAEFENYRKRVLREREDVRASARVEVLKHLLPVLDAAEKGLEGLPDPEGNTLLEGYLEGYQLLLREVRSVLERFGVEPVEGPGQHFDPNLHEAVLTEETDQHEDGVILEEFRRGYRCGDQLLRPSQVKVAVRPAAVEDDTDSAGAPGPPPAENGKIDIQA